MASLSTGFCPDCDEDVEITEEDHFTCPVCGAGLQSRALNQSSSNISSGTSLESAMGPLVSLLGEEGMARLHEIAQGSELEQPLNPIQAPSRGASAKVLASLHRFKVDEQHRILHEVVLEVFNESITGDTPSTQANKIRGVLFETHLGTFSPLPSQESSSAIPLCVSEPLTAEPAIRNGAMVDAGSAVLMSRGGCTFAAKGLRAQSAGAAVAVVINTQEVWPYVMRDTTGEAERGGLAIPVVMVPKSTGDLLLKTLKNGEKCEVSLRVHPLEDSCPVCQEDYGVNESLIRLPCRHMFHEECVLKWLEKHNTCPMCRHELPAADPSVNQIRRGRMNNAETYEAWRDWFT